MPSGDPFHRTGRPRHPDVLTPAEWEVLAGIREGLSNRQIAQRRGCDLETVRFHLKNVRRKLRVESRDGLRAFPGQPAAAIDRAAARARTHRVREQIPLVHTPDMARALGFYVTDLEASLAAGPIRLGLAQVETADAGRLVGLQTGLGFCVADLEAAHRRLADAGVRFTMEPEKQPWGGFMAMFEDPDGNVFYLDQASAAH